MDRTITFDNNNIIINIGKDETTYKPKSFNITKYGVSLMIFRYDGVRISGTKEGIYELLKHSYIDKDNIYELLMISLSIKEYNEIYSKLTNDIDFRFRESILNDNYVLTLHTNLRLTAVVKSLG